MCPLMLGLSDDSLKGPNSGFALGTVVCERIDHSECKCTILVPPADTTWVRIFSLFENGSASGINIGMEGDSSKMEVFGSVKGWESGKKVCEKGGLFFEELVVDLVACEFRRGRDGDGFRWEPKEG